MEIEEGNCHGPSLIRERETVGIDWHGMPESIHRLIIGFTPELKDLLKDAGLPQTQVDDIMEVFKQKFAVTLATSSMPLQDAIDLAIFLVETAIGFTRFSQGPDSVGGLAEVAALTKYEGLKWVRRRHYYDKDLNP